MRKLLSQGLAVALVLGLVCHERAQAQGDAKAVIEKAVEAQGGAKNLAKLNAVALKAKGTLVFGDLDVPFVADMKQQQPSQARAVFKLSLMGKDISVVQVLNGDKAWQQVEGMTMDSDAQALATAKDELYSSRVQMLTPLLTDKEFTLSSLGEVQVNGKAAVGIKVAATGKKDISLYFDKSSGQLVKLARRGVDPLKKVEVNQEEFYSEYKDFDGVKMPTKMLVNQDGKKSMSVELTGITFPGSFDAKLFARPE
jgi:hypothetical protein